MLILSAHLKLSLRHVDLPLVNEFDDEFEVVEAHVLRHYYRRMLAGVGQ